MVVALLCIAAGVISDKGGALIGVGAFWLVMAIIVRAKNTNKQPPLDNP